MAYKKKVRENVWGVHQLDEAWEGEYDDSIWLHLPPNIAGYQVLTEVLKSTVIVWSLQFFYEILLFWQLA